MTNQLIESPPPNARQVVPNKPAPLTEMPAPQSIGALAGALALARDRCKSAEKNSYNQHHKFHYASADEVVSTASDALEGSGLSLLPISARLTTLGSGNATIYALDRIFLLAHASGENVPLKVDGWPVMPAAGRPLDKAYAIALTTSLAYTLRDLLQMPRGDATEDMSARDDRNASPAPPPQQEPPVTGSHEQDAAITRQAGYQALTEIQAAREGEGRPANPTPTPQAEGSLTEEEYTEIVALARQHGRKTSEMLAICAVMGVRALDRAPRSRAPWLREAVVTGLVQPTAVDRLTAQIDALNISWTSVPGRLQATYQVASLAHLLPHQANELEQKFKAALSAKLEQAKETAPAA